MYLQQGDVILKKINELPKGKIKLTKKAILAEGELTGHCHTLIAPETLSICETDKGVFVKVDDKSELIHQEHCAIAVDPGIYEVVKVKEYNHFEEEIRNIVD